MSSRQDIFGDFALHSQENAGAEGGFGVDDAAHREFHLFREFSENLISGCVLI